MSPEKGKMRVLDLFSGIGGFSLGLDRTGVCETIAFVENNPFCQRVIAKHWPGVPIIDDVTTAEFTEGMADVVVGGFPCQDVSLAGRRAGLAGERSGLYRELVRALRVVRPRHAIVENVAALLSDGMGTVLGDMAESGFDLEWDCVPACAIGAPHERDRVYIVAHAHSERWGEAGRLQHRPLEVPAGGTEARSVAENAADVTGQQMGHAGQPRLDRSMEGQRLDPDAERDGRRQGRTRRPPDSFARIRDRARWHLADPYGSRLAFRDGLGRDAFEKQQAAKRDAGQDGWESVWPDEPALSGVDDGVLDWMDRVKATGNTILPQIPELIGRTIAQAEGMTE